jgi:hypothetical protein
VKASEDFLNPLLQFLLYGVGLFASPTPLIRGEFPYPPEEEGELSLSAQDLYSYMVCFLFGAGLA